MTSSCPSSSPGLARPREPCCAPRPSTASPRAPEAEGAASPWRRAYLHPLLAVSSPSLLPAPEEPAGGRG